MWDDIMIWVLSTVVLLTWLCMVVACIHFRQVPTPDRISCTVALGGLPTLDSACKKDNNKFACGYAASVRAVCGEGK